MDNPNELKQSIDDLNAQQVALQKLMYETNTLVRKSIGLNDSIESYTNQLSKHTEKTGNTLEMTNQALQILQKLTQGEAKFTEVLQQFRNDAQDKSEAFKHFVEFLLMNKEGYTRFTERLSEGMKTMDEDARRYLENRQQQLDEFYEISTQQFQQFVEVETKLFQDSIQQLKPEGLHHAIAQLELLTPIYKHVSQLEVSEEGAGLLARIDKRLFNVDKGNKNLAGLIDKQLKANEAVSVQTVSLLQDVVQQVKYVRYVILLGIFIMIVLMSSLF